MLRKKQYHSLSSSIAGIYRHSRNNINRYIKSNGIRGTQNDLIMHLYDHPGLSQRQIARDLCVDPSLLARDLKALIEQGLVSREQNPSDRRVNIITLTEKGADIAQDRIKAINGWWAELFDENPQIDPECFYTELRCVYNRLLTADA